MLRTEWRVLFHLGNYGPMTAGDIVTLAGIHKTKVSRAVQALADRRFLTRSRDRSHRRRETLTLTRAGLAAYADLRGVAMRYDADLAARFSKGDIAMLRRMLRRLANLPPKETTP